MIRIEPTASCARVNQCLREAAAETYPTSLSEPIPNVIILHTKTDQPDRGDVAGEKEQSSPARDRKSRWQFLYALSQILYEQRTERSSHCDGLLWALWTTLGGRVRFCIQNDHIWYVPPLRRPG